MELDALSQLGKVAGIAGIALGLVFILFRSIIQKDFFSSLSKDQSYRIIKLIIVSAVFVGLAGLGAWIYAETTLKKDDNTSVSTLAGKVVDETGKPIAGVEVFTDQFDNVRDFTDSHGKFLLPLRGQGSRAIDLRFSHKLFYSSHQKLMVEFKSSDNSLEVGDVALFTRERDETQMPHHAGSFEHVEQGGQRQSGGPDQNNNWSQPQQNVDGGSTISIFYDDEGNGCRLDIVVTIGGKSFIPKDNPVSFSGLKSGTQNYSISGTAFCPTGQCAIASLSREMVQVLSGGNSATIEQLRFFNEINVQNGHAYYLVFDTETCLTGIFDEATYRQLKAIVF